MRNKTRFAPKVDGLEERAYLSVAHPGLEGTVHVARSRAITTTGTIFGSFQIQLGATGPVLNIGGTGTVRPLGNVTASGNIGVAGLTPGQTVQGTVVLSGGNGGALLAIQGQIPRNVGAKSVNVRNVKVSILGGTGNFTGLHGNGTGTLSLKLQAPALTSGTFSFNFRAVGR